MNINFFIRIGCALNVVLLASCGAGGDSDSGAPATTDYVSASAWSEQGYRGKPASASTRRLMHAAEEQLPIGDFLDGSLMSEHSEDVLIAPLPPGVGALDPESFAFANGDRPDAIHPSIYSVMRDNLKDSGLFKIGEGMYQLRGDLAHITLVRGSTGWIVLDAGTTQEFSSAVWEFARELLPGGREVPISTVVYSHSHVDHFGGVKGLVSQADVDAGRVEVIAPYGFMQEALAENVIAGSAMLRRAQYHFGANLETLSDGTGRFYLSLVNGRFTLIAPTVVLPEGRGLITRRVVDGVEFHFKDISSAEAPSATLIYLPQHKTLFNSELMYRGLHNVYTLRGALVRDALGWSKLIHEVIQQWGSEVELMTGPHGPTFSGNDKIVEYMTLQRDNYGFIHNQAVRLINSGMKLQDVGEAVASMVPSSLEQVWHTHGYHGTYSHNARGVVNRYLGFYDGNPANLNPLSLEPEARKYVEYMGGAQSLLERAQVDVDNGEYRFAATALNKLVTAEPDNWPARHLLADAFEQLGYQSEGPQWRNAYLTAAKELRVGEVLVPDGDTDQSDLLAAATISDILDSLAVRVNAKDAEGKSIVINLTLTDTREKFVLNLGNSNLAHIEVEELGHADTSIILSRVDLMRLLTGQLTIPQIASLGTQAISGSPLALASFLSVIEQDNRYYDMVPMPGD